MPRKDSFTPHNGKQGLATNTHHTNDLTVTQMQRRHIGRMHLQHIGIDQIEDVRPACLGPTVVMLENTARGQHERIFIRRRLTRRRYSTATK